MAGNLARASRGWWDARHGRFALVLHRRRGRLRSWWFWKRTRHRGTGNVILVHEAGGGGHVVAAGARGLHAHACDEGVVSGFVGLHAALGVPAEAAGDKVEEGLVVALESLAERLGRWLSAATLVGNKGTGLVERVCRG